MSMIAFLMLVPFIGITAIIVLLALWLVLTGYSIVDTIHMKRNTKATLVPIKNQSNPSKLNFSKSIS